MARYAVALVLVCFVLACSGSAFAQAGAVCIFADSQGNDCTIVDQFPGLITLYVIHTDFFGANAVQFSAPVPGCMTGVSFLNDVPVFPVTIGDSQTGVAIGYAACLAGPQHVLTINLSASGLTSPNCAYQVLPDPSVGIVAATDCDHVVNEAVGGTSYVNSPLDCDCDAVLPPTLDVQPQSLAFAFDETSKQVQVLNIGEGVLNWSASTTATYLSLDKTSGTNDDVVTVTVDRTGLPEGNFTGTVAFTSNGGDIGVSVVVEVFSSPPVLHVTPALLYFDDFRVTRVISIQNTGGGTLHWQLAETIPWLALDNYSGSGGTSLQASVNRSSLAPGTYTGQIFATSNGGDATIDVVMVVAAPMPELGLSTTTLNFVPQSVVQQNLSISNVGTGVLLWNIASNSPWLATSASSGTDNASLIISVDRTGLTDGLYTGELAVTSNGGDATVAVFMRVGESPVLSVTPTSHDLGLTQDTFQFNVTNTGGGELNWTATTNGLVTVSPTSAANDAIVNGTVDRSVLAPGSYRGEVYFEAEGEGGAILAVVDFLVLNPNAELGVFPSSFDFGTSQETDVLTLTNNGLSPLNWSISTSESWLSVDQTSGTLGTESGVDNSIDLTVTVDRSGLPDALYGANIDITSNGGNATVPVSMTVFTMPVLNVFPSQLFFTQTVTNNTFSIVNVGAGTLSWSLGASDAWIDIQSPTSGTGDAVIQVHVDPNQVPPGGTQFGAIDVASNGGSATVNIVFTPPGTGIAGVLSLYADPGGMDCNIIDNAPGLLPVFVVHTMTPGATASQFAAPMPACMTGAAYLSDTGPIVVIGNSQTGVAVGYGVCLAAPITVMAINYFVNGQSQPCCMYPVVPDPNVPSGQIEVVDCTGQVIPGTGGFAYVNPDGSCSCDQTVATEEKTWGGIKALYATEPSPEAGSRFER